MPARADENEKNVENICRSVVSCKYWVWYVLIVDFEKGVMQE